MRCVLASLTFAATLAKPHAAPSPTPGPDLGAIVYLTDAAKTAGAVCLDGSPAALYVAPNVEKKKIYVHQQGGGWCGSDNDCLGRSKTALGSSKSYKPTMGFTGGYLSSDPAQNPLMHNFTKVYLPYCDGGSQTGDVDAPVSVGSSTIFYRGHRILRAVQDYLASTTLDGATDIVVSGCSAGGLATYLHADEWAAAFPAARVTAMPDSGFFLNYNNTAGSGYGSLMRWVASAMNSTLPAACVAANAADPASCIFAEVISETLKTPTFALQGKYDSWQIGNDAHTNANNTAAINSWGAMLSQRIGSGLLAQPQHGAFLDSCYHHCGGFDNFHVDGFTQATAHQAWYSGGARTVYNQTRSYPCPSCCN